MNTYCAISRPVYTEENRKREKKKETPVPGSTHSVPGGPAATPIDHREPPSPLRRGAAPPRRRRY